MSTRRTTVARCGLAVALVACTLGSGAAWASAAKLKKAKPVCYLVKAKPAHLSDPSLDIVSADVATNKTTLTWVIRVVKLASGGSDQQSPLGRHWTFAMAANNVGFGFDVYDGPFGTTSGYGSSAHVTIDTRHNQIRFSAPLTTVYANSQVRSLKPGTVLDQLYVHANEDIQYPAGDATGAHSQGSFPNAPQDTATSFAKYVAGSRSCVKVGS